MDLYPAIDIQDGRAVRLRRGHFDRPTVYAPDPLDAARAWVEAGARRLHVVDLDGAREGRPVALSHVRRIASRLDVAVQYGGGLRTLESLSAALEAGAARVVLGTAAHRDPGLLDAALERHHDRLAVAVDVRGGRLATHGWTRTTELDGREAVQRLRARGVQAVVYTDAERDGTLEGPDLEEVTAVAGATRGGRLIYSGGVGRLEDLERLAALGAQALDGVIVGKALYEGRFSVAEAQRALDGGD
ncbi:MAG TPA: 1-(5-phosphoribosyl)-5-[(5-phosphoribosylamino)methylideneamino]imidazole-4-carboxamide isomerase [Solirubrobacteraceae bacterium]|jgi:phosphoribosylformimino-5-aminoimidazole carboxamide ribotide isomerase|nr:1-(5-phosphoribosyl)-5-[(5-phosphoribosylamino)methylideneamino]imidazole-4-carboxamide isomerase [Solirubrobacteraceae bacterium]